jgi:predicted Rossmann fold nucleotide-binding protein DprA/Smf involved in DNA uptake
MHPEAAYWTLLSGHPPEDEAAIARLLAAWHARGKRSINDLFERDPDAVADLIGVSVEALAPLLRLRSRLTQAHRLVDRLARDDVELVTIWERRYPKRLKDLLGDAAPLALWHAGALKLLDAAPVALLGSRESPVEALDFAHQLGAGLARAGRPVLTGMSRAVERAALESALRTEGGTAVVILGQGIARAMADLRHWQPAIRGNRLLVASLLHPEAAWQPWLESLRGLVTIGLADKVVVAHARAGEDVWETAQQALTFEHDVFIHDGVDGELERLGAISLPDGKHAAGTVIGVQPLLGLAAVETAPPAPEPDTEIESTSTQAAMAGDPLPPVASFERPSNGAAPIDDWTPEAPAPEFQLLPPPAPAARSVARQRGTVEPSLETLARMPLDRETPLETVLLTLLARGKKAIGKGTLLLALGVDEATLDEALAALISAREIVQRPARGGIGYSLVDPTRVDRTTSAFQPSLFGKES